MLFLNVICLADGLQGILKPHHSSVNWMSKCTSLFKVIHRLKTIIV